MVKCFVTGDNHIGKKYDRYPEIRDLLIESRFECLQDMIQYAERDECELFIVTGDLFENTNTVKVADVKRTAEILAAFTGTVLVLPGNHDYYTGDEKVWQDFEKALAKLDHNVVLLNKYEAYTFDTVDETVVVYPAFCQSKHSDKNNLGWIKQAQIDPSVINIGVAHGAIQGVTPDMNGQYFIMTEQELLDIPVDAWMIGHTHIPYPNCLKETEETTGYKIFNAGTHVQTDLSNATEGNGFIISISKEDGKKTVSARKYVSGKIRFYDLKGRVKPQSDTALFDVLSDMLKDISHNSVIRVKLSGAVKQIEYERKEEIYKELFGKYLTYEVDDRELNEEISVEKIRAEYAQTSFAAQFLEQFIGNPAELQMAYELVKACKDK